VNNDIFASQGFKTTQFLHRILSHYCWCIVFAVKVQESYNCPYVSRNEAFVSLILGGSEWSESRPNRFNPEEIASNKHWTGVWLCFRDKLDISEKRKFVAPDGNRNTETWLVYRLAPRLGSILVAVTSAPLLCYLCNCGTRLSWKYYYVHSSYYNLWYLQNNRNAQDVYRLECTPYTFVREDSIKMLQRNVKGIPNYLLILR